MSPQSTILTVEDDPAIRRGIVDALTFRGFRTLEAATGDSGKLLALTASYDLLLLDLALPGLEGLSILREVKRVLPGQPVIILTAKGDEKDRVEGLRSGADDYVVKPFSVLELLARVDAVLRRTPARPIESPTVEFGKGVIDFSRREIRTPVARIEISERESDLLRYLAANRNRAISREELLANVWRLDPHGVNTRTIDMHIVRLRDKLGDTGPRPEILLTVRGKGYMFQCLPGGD